MPRQARVVHEEKLRKRRVLGQVDHIDVFHVAYADLAQCVYCLFPCILILFLLCVYSSRACLGKSFGFSCILPRVCRVICLRVCGSCVSHCCCLLLTTDPWVCFAYDFIDSLFTHAQEKIDPFNLPRQAQAEFPLEKVSDDKTFEHFVILSCFETGYLHDLGEKTVFFTTFLLHKNYRFAKTGSGQVQ